MNCQGAIMQDIIGNKTEEAVNFFLNKLDEDESLGPKPISGVNFCSNLISDSLECTDEIAKKLFSQPSIFMFDELDQVFLEVFNDDSNEFEKFYLISNQNDPSFSLVCEKIGSNLPEVTYDLECGGYPSRQNEAASLYKLAVVNKLQEGQYDEEIKTILSGYDFSRWVGRNGNYAFTELLQKVQEEADTISRVVLMCANTKLISDKVKKDTSYKGILKEEDAEKLRILAEEDARTNFLFNKKYEIAGSIKEKIQIGEELANKRVEFFSQKIFSPEISVLFSIYSLNQNAIPGKAKRKIRNAAGNYVLELTEQKLINDPESAAEFKKKLIIRAQKLFLSRMKQIRYVLWRDRTPDMDLSSLIPKF